MESIKRDFDGISLLSHVSRDLSSLRRHKLKPTLYPRYAGICELEYSHTKQFFGEDINQSLVRAKEVGGLHKQFQHETY